MLDLGGIYPAALNVSDQNGNPTNATTITLTITQPDGTTVTPVPLNPVTGQYTYSYQTVQAGRHLVRWVTTVPSTGYTDVFDVAEAQPPAILSLAQAKTQLQIDPANTEDDVELREYLNAVTAAIENYKNEVIVRRTIVESHTFSLFTWNFASPRLRLWEIPVIQLVSVISNDPGTSSFSWDVVNALSVDTSTGIITVLNGPPISGDVTCTYIAGYVIVPYNYLLGAKIALQHIWETRRGVGGLGGAVGPEELHIAVGHAYVLPKKAIEALGAPMPAVA